MRRHIVVVGLLVFMLLSGCVGSDEKPAAASSSAPATTSAAADPGAEVGSVRGTVVTDEQLPIAGVSVAITQLSVQVETDAEGSFEIGNVPFGKHDVVAARLGYQSVAKRVEVASTEPVQLTLVLSPIEVVEGYHITLHHVAMFHVASTYPTWVLNMTGLSNSCEGCTWVINTTTPATSIQWEIYGKHTVTNPQGDAEYLWIFRDRYALTGGGERIYNNVNGKLPLVVSFDDSVIKKTTTFYSQILCDYYWFCFEEKRDMWFTAFYNEEMPEGYLAVPKD